MQLGSLEEISQQELAVHAAEVKLMQAKLRLRALKGESLMQMNDSYPTYELSEAIDALCKEFGSRNLVVMG